MRDGVKIAGPDYARRTLDAAKKPQQIPPESAATYLFGVVSGNTYTTLPASGANTPGAWQQMWAAGFIAVPVLVHRIVFGNGNGFGNIRGVVELGTGGSGAEAVIGSWQIMGDTGGIQDVRLGVPLLIPGGVRLAARLYTPLLAAGFGVQIRQLIMVQDV